MRRLALVVAGISLVAAAHAATITVAVHPAVANVPAAPITVTAAIEGTTVRKSFVVPVNRASSIEISAAKGSVCLLSGQAPGVWVQPAAVVATDGPMMARLEVFRAAVVRGKIAFPSDAPKATAMTIAFRSGGASPVAGEIDCPIVADGNWNCVLPALTSDLRLKSRGFMAHYKWDVKLTPDTPFDIGVLQFRRGASVVGRVEIDDRHTPLAAVIRLQPQLAPASAFHKEPAVRALALTATANAKGFFAFDGVPPGAYVIDAVQKGFASEPRDVRVLANVEAELAKPLRLVHPEGVLVAVSPAADPASHPWRLRLRPSGVNVLPINVTVDTRGEHEFRGLASGKYALTVLSADGASWGYQSIDVTPTTPPIAIDLDLVRVKGRVTLGDRPVVAKVWFGGEHGAVTIPFATTADGRFDGYLPHGGRWPVQINADDQKIRKFLPKIDVHPPKSGGAADVRLELPSTRVSGIAVSEMGSPVKSAIVNARTEDGVVQQITGEDGRFTFEGLTPGSVQLTASAAGTLVSKAVDVTLDDGGEVNDAKVVLLDAAFLRGRVVSSAGGVPVAVVYAFPAGDPTPTMAPTTCNESGEFRVRLTPGTTSAALIVTAAGFSLHTERVAVDRGPVTVVLGQTGGRVEMSFDEKRAAPPILFKDGIPIHFAILASWARATGGSVAATHVTAEQLEPGSYAMCFGGLAAPSDCRRGALEPLGELKLASQ